MTVNYRSISLISNTAKAMSIYGFSQKNLYSKRTFKSNGINHDENESTLGVSIDLENAVNAVNDKECIQ